MLHSPPSAPPLSLPPQTSSFQDALPYSPHLHAAAQAFIRTHFPPPLFPSDRTPGAAAPATTGQTPRYVAAHWRLEKSLLQGVRPSALLRCARGLVASVMTWRRQLAKCGGEGRGGRLPGFFLASDVGPQGELRSSSFSSLSISKRRAAQKAVQVGLWHSRV